MSRRKSRNAFLSLPPDQRAILVRQRAGKTQVKIANIYHTTQATICRLMGRFRIPVAHKSRFSMTHEDIIRRVIRIGNMSVVAREIGCSREWVRQVCVTRGLTAKKIRLMNRKEKPPRIDYLEFYHKPSKSWYVKYRGTDGRMKKITRSRYFMQQKLGRLLLPSERVIHGNLQADDDGMDNLKLVRNRREAGLHTQSVLKEIRKERKFDKARAPVQSGNSDNKKQTEEEIGKAEKPSGQITANAGISRREYFKRLEMLGFHPVETKENGTHPDAEEIRHNRSYDAPG